MSDTHIWCEDYTEGVPNEISLKFNSLNELFYSTVNQYSNKISYESFFKGISFSQLDELSSRFASYLHNELGLVKGDRFAIMLPNILQFPIAFWGAIKAGVIVVNINPQYTKRELFHQLNDAGVKAMIIFEKSAHLLDNHNKDVPSLKSVILTSVGEMLSFPKGPMIDFYLRNIKKKVPAFKVNGVSFSTVIRCKLPYIEEKKSLNDCAIIQYTGGTTGISKGAILTHQNLLSNIEQASVWLKHVLVEDEIMITPLPLYHVFSLTACALAYFAFGAKNVLIANPHDTNSFVKVLRKNKFTALTGVSALFGTILKHKHFDKIDFSNCSMALSGGMPLNLTMAENFKEKSNVMIYEGYGLTEMSPLISVDPIDESKVFEGFVGMPVSSTDVKIINENEDELPLGEIGEIVANGPQLMSGYWGKEDTDYLTRDGFLKTGDIGFLNEKGHLKIVDRMKDMILVSGFNVFPIEVEEVAQKHEKVVEAAAIGAPDEKCGEKVQLYVVPKDESLTAAELIQFMKSDLTRYKMPKEIVLVDSLPKSAVGKILRRELREKYKLECL